MATPNYQPAAHLHQLRATGKIVFFTTIAAMIGLVPSPAKAGLLQAYVELIATVTLASFCLRPNGSSDTVATVWNAALTKINIFDFGHGHGMQVLAGIDTVCVDKLDLLSASQRLVGNLQCLNCTQEDLVLAAVCANHPSSRVHEQDPTSAALNNMLEQWPKVKAKTDKCVKSSWQWKAVREITQAVVELPGEGACVCARGSVSAMVDYLDIFSERSQENACAWLKKAYEVNASQGIDTLAIAKRRVHAESEWVVLGTLRLLDQTRVEASFAILLAKELGVSVKMFANEARAITEKTAHVIGLRPNIMTASEAASAEDDVFATTDAFTECSSTRQQSAIIGAAAKRGYRIAAAVQDPRALESVDCGIALAGASERLATAADIGISGKDHNSLGFIVNAIKAARMNFYNRYGGDFHSVACLLPMLFVVCWHFVMQGEVLRLRMWVLAWLPATSGTQIAGLFMQWPVAEVEYPNRPVSWETLDFVQDSRATIVVATVGVMVTYLTLADQGLLALSQGLCLHFLLFGHGLSILARTGKKFWTKTNACWLLKRYVVWDLGVTALCVYGRFVAEVPLEPAACAWVWFASLLTLGALWLLRGWQQKVPHVFNEDFIPWYQSLAEYAQQ